MTETFTLQPPTPAAQGTRPARTGQWLSVQPVLETGEWCVLPTIGACRELTTGGGRFARPGLEQHSVDVDHREDHPMPCGTIVASTSRRGRRLVVTLLLSLWLGLGGLAGIAASATAASAQAGGIVVITPESSGPGDTVIIYGRELGTRTYAVELGDGFASMLRTRFDGRRLDVVTGEFEAVHLEPDSFDLIAAATSFHWIPTGPGMRRAADLLVSGGSIALWWTHFGDPDRSDPFRDAVQPILEDRAPSLSDSLSRGAGIGAHPYALDAGERIAEIDGSNRFGPVEHTIVPWTTTQTSDDIRRFLVSFSSWMVLDARLRLHTKSIAAVPNPTGIPTPTVNEPIAAAFSVPNIASARNENKITIVVWIMINKIPYQTPIQKDIDLQRLYTTKEINELLERKFERNKPNLQLRNKIIVQLLAHQALKTSELTSLRMKDINLENGEIHIQNSRILKLESSQIIPLFTYLQNHKKDLLLTTKNGNPIANETIRFIINYGYDKTFIPIKIRQTIIHLLLKKGEQLRKVQIFAGHKYISSTQQYLGDNLDALKSIIQKNHPL